ncbi:acetoin utilization protein AcuC [Effusibacillus lacus]|uniref:Acetoin utilization protein AcuC n=1 Tax=Effusibacillus lacus TaxID=1348429 RepID=A0A292YND6_9BACL|nr:hypothetical protein EDD64_12957 [Effusibacillus lacus]GAX89990.1 acetoin utilization protein AcuC [Effusibacillus lacus]
MGIGMGSSGSGSSTQDCKVLKILVTCRCKLHLTLRIKGIVHPYDFGRNHTISPLKVNIVNRLIRFGLIRELDEFVYGDTGEDIKEDILVLTSYGESFIRFIRPK